MIDGFQRLTTLTILLCALRDLDSGADRPANARLLGGDPAGHGCERASRAWCCARRRRSSSSRTCARPAPPRAKPSADGLSLVGRADRGGARPHPVRARRPRRRRAPAARRFPARPVLRGARRDDRHRSRPSHVHRSQYDGQVIGTQRYSQGLPVRQRRSPAAVARCLAIWNDAEARLGDEFENLFSHIRSMFGRPGSQVIAGIRRDRRGKRRASVHRGRAAAVGAHHGRHPECASRRNCAFGRHQPVPALSRLALVCRLETGGADVVDEERRGRRSARSASWPSSIDLPSASAFWGSAAQNAPGASER